MKFVKFRIVRDSFLGYEVQLWCLWRPFWMQASYANTHSSITEAENFITNHWMYPSGKTFISTFFK